MTAPTIELLVGKFADWLRHRRELNEIRQMNRADIEMIASDLQVAPGDLDKLIAALADTADPDSAFASFDRFLAELPAGVQVFSLLRANPNLMRLIADIMGTAPRLARILSRLGAEPWQARAMADASRSALPDQQLQLGMEVHVILLPSVVRPNRMTPSRISVYSETHEHRVTVMRNAAGEFTASATPVDRRIVNAETSDDDTMTTSSLYAALHQTAEKQGVDRDTILQILRIHAYETDFRQRVRPGDGFEFFFDIRDEEKGADGSLGELLATSITAGGETRKFYRFRSPDGGMDYYDENGDTSRKFLMRRPVRSDDVRITSGFGVRRHPILQTPRMHTGVDWACAPGTPIMAAGHGVIEEADRKGEYGNYIRIRHANGYKTAYGHMSKFAPGMAPGTKVRQGQIIGYVGSTGLSSGPHVHYEVLVNNTFVDPTTLQVPRERQLSGLLLAEFQRERQRIDDLMRRNPVSTRMANAAGG